ncbi:lipid II-degrading bacteriocin [Burkholderia gladioli]|uniref:lipid II-degrading bacteriocin n=1 Tax=Burkholderia gladioli TaxID=28095 RepID=UPI00163E1225|nr:lipid II-degrading bacteriocin [Burkholderia gladioli]
MGNSNDNNKFKIRRSLIGAIAPAPALGLSGMSKSLAIQPEITLAPIIVDGSGNVITSSPADLPRMGHPALPPELMTNSGTTPILLLGKVYLINGLNILGAASQGDTIGTLTALAQGLVNASDMVLRAQLGIYASFSQWLGIGEGFKNIAGATPYGLTLNQSNILTSLFGVYAAQYYPGMFLQQPSNFQFYGTALLTTSAIYYWLYGDGSMRSMNIESMNLQMGIADFDPIKRVALDLANGPGTYHIDAQFDTNLFSHGDKDIWVAGILGRVTGRVFGDLVLTDTTYSFNGYWTLYDDRYEAYPSTRPGYQEVLNNFLMNLGAKSHNDYDITFIGNKGVTISGQRPNKEQAVSPTGQNTRPSFGGLPRNPPVID